MCAPSIFAGPVMTHAKLLSHAAAAEAEAARWASEGAFLLPLLRRRDAAALRRLALATAPAWGAVHAVREVA